VAKKPGVQGTRKPASTARRSPQAPARSNRASLSKILAGLTFVGAVGIAVLGVVLVRQNDANPSVADQFAQNDPGPVHIHGLGINPADRSLFIATHTGTWRVPNGKTTAERVGDNYQDTMGFTVVGPNRFLGSGHPATADQPPLLGLIESDDAGKTWRPVSLLGEADFHVLRSVGQRIYGWDATNARLMFSRDTGKTWTQRDAPGSVVDLAADPKSPTTVVAETDRGIYRSTDEGRTWKRVALGPIGFLAWPAVDRLYLVDASGGVAISRAQGARWKPKGSIGGQPAAFLATSPSDLYAALADGVVKRSTDGGTTWTVRSKP
jgi:hypothetical protein